MLWDVLGVILECFLRYDGFISANANESTAGLHLGTAGMLLEYYKNSDGIDRRVNEPAGVLLKYIWSPHEMLL